MQPSRSNAARTWRLVFILLGALFVFLVLFSPVSAIYTVPDLPSSQNQAKLNTGLHMGFPVVLRELPASSPGPGILLISEVLYNPTGREPEGEWVELYNAGGSPIDLNGYKIGDQALPGCCEGMMAFPAGAVLQPGEVIVLAFKASAFEAVYRFKPDYEMENTDASVPVLAPYTTWAERDIELTNTGDELLVLGPTDQIVDALSWGSSKFAFDPPVSNVLEGTSLERYPIYTDTDSALDWRKQQAPRPGEVDLSLPTATPGPLPPPTLVSPVPPTPMPTPFGGKLLLSEFLYDPFGTEPDGEWIEIYNAGTAAIRLQDFKLGDEETRGEDEGMLRFPAGSVLDPGQPIVVAHHGNAFFNQYGELPDYEVADSLWQVPDMLSYPTWGSTALSLHNEGDELLILDGLDQVIDALSYGSSQVFFSPSLSLSGAGCSIERYPGDQDSNTVSDWLLQCTPSPGRVVLPAPPTLTPVPILVINEIHHAPDPRLGDANRDGVVDPFDDEFVEIANLTGEPVNLAGWCLSDGLACRHVFPSPSWIPQACSAVIFGHGDPTGDFGASLVQVSTTYNLSLNDTGDTLTLIDASGASVLSFSYSGTYAGQPVTGQSLVRYPELTGSELIPHTTAPEAAGALYSPGTHLDGSPFPGCSSTP